MPTILMPVELTEEAYNYALTLPDTERGELVSLASSVALVTAAHRAAVVRAAGMKTVEIWSPYDAHDAGAAMLSFLEESKKAKQ